MQENNEKGEINIETRDFIDNMSHVSTKIYIS